VQRDGDNATAARQAWGETVPGEAADTRRDRPLVSIGLIAYNEDCFIYRTIESLLAQEFRDFELVISDNASTDRTGEICLDFASKDPRVIYDRSPENVGAIGNFNRVAERCSGEYFMLACGHDLWSPLLLSRCVDILKSDPGVVLCFSDCAYIDSHGKVIQSVRPQVDTRGMDLRARFNAVLWMTHGAALRQVLPMRSVIGPDNIMLAELAFLGTFARVPEELFFLRIFRTCGYQVSTNERLFNKAYSLWRSPAMFGRFAYEFLAMVRRRSPSLPEKVRLSAATSLRLAKMACGFFGTLVMSQFCPKTYERLLKWLVPPSADGR
jgi:glycosyltransferase involved in cell wall biosynthesis